jgi:hypothetical protein
VRQICEVIRGSCGHLEIEACNGVSDKWRQRRSSPAQSKAGNHSVPSAEDFNDFRLLCLVVDVMPCFIRRAAIKVLVNSDFVVPNAKLRKGVSQLFVIGESNSLKPLLQSAKQSFYFAIEPWAADISCRPKRKRRLVNTDELSVLMAFGKPYSLHAKSNSKSSVHEVTTGIASRRSAKREP